MGKNRRRKASNKQETNHVDIEAALKEQRERHQQAREPVPAPEPHDSQPQHIPGFVFDATSQRYYRASGLRNPSSLISMQSAADSATKPQLKQRRRVNCWESIPMFEPASKLNLLDRLRQREYSLMGRCRGDVAPNMLARSRPEGYQYTDTLATIPKDVDFCPSLNFHILATDLHHIAIFHRQFRDKKTTHVLRMACRFNNGIFRVRNCLVGDRLLVVSCGDRLSVSTAPVDGLLDAMDSSTRTMEIGLELAHLGARSLFHSTMDIVNINGQSNAIASTLEGSGRFLAIDLETGQERVVPGQWRQHEEPACLHEFADNQMLCGMRNGAIRLFDLRSNDTLMMGSLPIRCNHGHAIGNSQYVLFQDMIGNLRMYDIRKPRAYVCQYVQAYQNESAFRSRRFTIDEQERYICISKDGGELQALSIRSRQAVANVKIPGGEDIMLTGNATRQDIHHTRTNSIATSPWDPVPIAGLNLRSGALHIFSI